VRPRGTIIRLEDNEVDHLLANCQAVRLGSLFYSNMQPRHQPCDPDFRCHTFLGPCGGCDHFATLRFGDHEEFLLKMPSRMLRLPLLDLPHVFMKESVWIVRALHTLATASQALDIIHTVSWILSD